MVEKYVRLVQDMYEGSETVVRCAVGTTEIFMVKVGLYQGSALSPFLFAVVMDRLTDKVRREPPWTMLFADDIVICEETREEHLCVNGGNDKETVNMDDTKVPRVKKFKFWNQRCKKVVVERGRERVNRRVHAGWNGRREISAIICDRSLPARVKGKVYSSVVRPAMLYELETVAVKKKQVE